MKLKLFILFVFSNCILFAQNLNPSKGELLFMDNKPEQAVLFLEEEVKVPSASPKLYNYLGLAYYQLGQYEKSIEAFARGLKTSGTNKKLLSYNQGNSYFAIKDYKNAINSYSLSITADGTRGCSQC